MDLLVDGFRQAFGLLASGNAEIRAVLWLSLLVSSTATFVAVLGGAPAGGVRALGRFPGGRLLISAVNAGMGLPPVVVGLFVSILLWRSGPLGALEILYTPAALIVAQAVIAWPIVTGITLAAVQNVPEAFRLQLKALLGPRPPIARVLLRGARLP